MKCSVFVTAAVILAAVLPGAARSDNREIAQRIGQQLRNSGQLVNYSVSVRYNDGTAFLSGRVTSEEQVSTAVEMARQCPEVNDVVSQLKIVNPVDAGQSGPTAALRTAKKSFFPVRKAAASEPRAGFDPQQIRSMPVPRRQLVRGGRGPAMDNGVRPAQHMVDCPVESYGDMSGMAMGGATTMSVGNRPLPAYSQSVAGGAAPVRYDQPAMPNYAWPSYSPYPNYAALTYPKQYSPTVWPYIGPFYPYPQVPLGWRKVTLEWDDGWWFLDFKDDPSNCWESCCN